MASSFNQEKAIEQAFLGEVAPGGGTSLQTLASLRAMQQFYNASDAEYQALQSIAREEARYYVAGAMAIRNDPVLQQQLGTAAYAATRAIAIEEESDVAELLGFADGQLINEESTSSAWWAHSCMLTG